jgi:type IV pilus assembly protein PilM
MKFKFPYFKSNQMTSTIGIDVGSSSVKLAHLVYVDGQPTLMKGVTVGIDVDKEEDRQQATIAALKNGVAEISAKSAQVVCVFNSPEAYAGRVIVPPMPPGELPEAIKWEVKRYLSFPLEEAIFSFDISGELVDKGIKKLSVAVAAFPKKSIEAKLSLLTRAGIKVAAILPVAFALQNLIRQWQYDPKENIAIMEMGACVTELDIYQDGLLAFSRKLPIAGKDITKGMMGAITSAQGPVALTWKEAERAKQQMGLSSDGKKEMIEGKISSAQMLSLMRPFIEQLASETERSCDFYREASHGGKVDRIFVFGGGARLKGLVPFLSEELEVEVQEGDCLQGVSQSTEMVGKESIRHSFDVAVGAALAGTTEINLFPFPTKGKTKRFLKRVFSKVIVAFIVIFSYLFYISMITQLESYEKAFKALNLEYQILTDQLKGLKEKMLVRQISGNTPYWEDILKEISHTIPENIYLTHLSMGKEVVYFKGIITPGQQATESALSQLMLGLEGGIFKNVRLIAVGKKTDDPSLSEFEIKAEVE